ncbi:valine-containing leader peptide [Corynebacterium glutamicum MB001]|nr:hypothetical leader peptide (ilvB 5' region) - Corynebacterium glutamicum [Corynebacterium glutamicum]AGT05259.1 valine-containing leader peptide [Corynebacterium glutamicum MB001]ASW13908.1 valine-containing leader peptide [Corynebacterium glutamicum]QYO73497.1 valine-containing leader peptide [Corynebacterium glutamicum]
MTIIRLVVVTARRLP